jgi:hypothetical protein
MDPTVLDVALGTKFLDRLIQEQRVTFVVWLVFLCLLVIVWIFARQRKRPILGLQVARLLPGIVPGPEPDPESSVWEEHFDP